MCPQVKYSGITASISLIVVCFKTEFFCVFLDSSQLTQVYFINSTSNEFLLSDFLKSSYV